MPHRVAPKSVTFLSLNARSLVNKYPQFSALLGSSPPDVCCVVETYLDPSISSGELFSDYYDVHRLDRNRHGGGILIACAKFLRSSTIPSHQPAGSSLVPHESLWVRTNNRNEVLIIGCHYRPPASNAAHMESFCYSTSSLLNQFASPRVILCGDFNLPDVNWNMNTSTSAISSSLIQFAEDHHLDQLINDVTWPSSGSTLDLVFTSHPALISDVDIISGISDHSAIQFKWHIRTASPIHLPTPILLHHKADFNQIGASVSLFCETFSLSDPQLRTVDDNWDLLKQALVSASVKFTPCITQRKSANIPWLNQGLLKRSKKKNRLFLKAKHLNSTLSWSNYRSFRDVFRSDLKSAYKSHMEGLAKDLVQNRKKFFRALNAKKQDHANITSLVLNDEVISSSSGMAQAFADHFQSVFTVEDCNSIPLLPSNVPPLPEIQLDVRGVQKLLENLDGSKSPGPDNIPPILLKNCAEVIAPVLTVILQQSFNSSIFPVEWKSSSIQPLHKSGSRSSCTNYRPIAISSAVSKVAEHIFISHLWRHLNSNSIISPVQHGFRKQFNTETLLLSCLEEWSTALDNGETVDVIFIDFAKAFDAVPHEKLKAKLHSVGVKGRLLSWVSSYLSNRYHTVFVNGGHSSPFIATSGVPQGSVAGPTFFSVYVNDLPPLLQSLCNLFADDLGAHRVIKNMQDCKVLQLDLDQICSWSSQWQLPINYRKCVHIRITRRLSVAPFVYSLNGHPIPQVDSVTYLGVTISNDLKWGLHCSKLASKANGVLGFLKRNLKGCTSETKSLSYKTYVRPILEYASAAWDPYTQKDTYLIERVQRRAARFVTSTKQDFSNPRSVTNILVKLKWPTLSLRRKTRRLSIFHNAIFHDSPALDWIVKSTKPSGRNCGGKPHVFLRPFARTDVRKFSFLNRTVKDWNELPYSVHSASSFSLPGLMNTFFSTNVTN